MGIGKLTLKESSAHPVIIPTETTLSVQGLGSSRERGAEAVLVVHYCSQRLYKGKYFDSISSKVSKCERESHIPSKSTPEVP